MISKIITFMGVLLFYITEAIASILNLTCYTEFIEDVPSNTKTPIYFAKIDFQNNHMTWSDSKKRMIKLDISEDTIRFYADSGVALRKFVSINRINGSFRYLRPNIKNDGTMYGATSYEGKCEVGVKKKLF